jgi:CheY-specific phosphatase CheX
MDRKSVDLTHASTRALVELLAAEACVDVFAAHNVELRSLADSAPPSEGDVMTGIIGFSGPGIWGMCLMSSSRSPILASNPVASSTRDWLAELVNQLAGRLKRKLIGQGATVYITTPIVLRAARVEPVPKGDWKPRAFAAADGIVELWVEVETAADFQLTPGAAETTLSVGESILF